MLPAPLTHVIFKTYNILQLSSGAETTTHLWMNSIPDMGSGMLWVSCSSHLSSAVIAVALLHISPYLVGSSQASSRWRFRCDSSEVDLFPRWSTVSNGNNYLGRASKMIQHLQPSNRGSEILHDCRQPLAPEKTNKSMGPLRYLDGRGWLTKPGSNMFQPCSWSWKDSSHFENPFWETYHGFWWFLGKDFQSSIPNGK